MSDILALSWQIADALRLQRPLTLFGSADEGDITGRILLRSMTQTCRFLSGFDWSVLKSTHNFTSLAQEEQTDKMPADFGRIVDGTFWDADINRRIIGPIDDEEYIETKTTPVGRVDPSYKLFGDVLHLLPVPTLDRNYTFLYIREALAKDMAGTFLKAFYADTDTALWNDELIILGTVYQYRKNERLDYAQDEIDFKIARQDALMRDGGSTSIGMGDGGRTSDDLVQRMKSAALILS